MTFTQTTVMELKAEIATVLQQYV